MAKFRLPQPVEFQIAELLKQSAARFGEAGRERYAALIFQAMRDVADEPDRFGVRTDPAVAPTVLFYHLRYSRRRAAAWAQPVRRPRHYLVFSTEPAGEVVILGLVPDMVPPGIGLARLPLDPN